MILFFVWFILSGLNTDMATISTLQSTLEVQSTQKRKPLKIYSGKIFEKYPGLEKLNFFTFFTCLL